MYFSQFRNYLPLEEGGDTSFEQTLISFTQVCFVPSLIEICPVVLEKKMKMWKVSYRRTDRQTTDKKCSENLTIAFSSSEIKMKIWTLFILPPQKIVPCKSCFYLNKKAFSSLHVVLFALYYSNLLIHCHYNW